MRTLTAPLGLAALLIAVLAPFLYVTGNPAIYFTHIVLPGQVLYVLSKLCALLALFCLGIQSMGGLMGEPFYRHLNIRHPVSFHRTLGITTLCLVTGHIGLFTAGVSVRSEKLSLQFLWFNFGDFYHIMLSIGLIAFMLMIIANSTRLIKNRAPRLSLWLHRLNLIAIGLILFHAYHVGTETRFLSVTIFMILLGVAILYGLGTKITPKKLQSS